MATALRRALELTNTQQRYLLGIAGKPGAGKSTFTEYLKSQIDSQSIAILPMDGFHMSNEKLVELGRRDRKGAPDTFEVEQFAHTLHEVKSGYGQSIRFPLFDRESESSIQDAGLIAPNTTLVVVEGNYLLLEQGEWRSVRTIFDETWYLETPEELRLERLIARHIRYGKTPQEARTWAVGSDETNAQIIGATESLADYIVELSENF